jgi:hypothetical protein
MMTGNSLCKQKVREAIISAGKIETDLLIEYTVEYDANDTLEAIFGSIGQILNTAPVVKNTSLKEAFLLVKKIANHCTTHTLKDEESAKTAVRSIRKFHEIWMREASGNDAKLYSNANNSILTICY